MKRLLWLLPVPALAGGVFAILSACNSGTDNCPDKSQITPGGACSDDFGQCAYDLQTPAPACDGTTTTIASSCTCTKGLWVCPSPIVCGDASTADGNADDGSSEDGNTDDGGKDDGATEDGEADDGSGGDATPDAAADGAKDAPAG